jgi:hypothetical protein
MLLPEPLMELARQSALIPDALPVRQRAQVTVSGLAGGDVEETVKLGASWAIDAVALHRWLGVEARPLAVEGVLTLSAEGMLLDGVVRSAIEPETLFDGSVHLTAFVPFRRHAADAFLEARADIAIPLASVATGAHARLNLSEKWAVLEQKATGSAQAIQGLAARGGDWLSTLPEINIARRNPLQSGPPTTSPAGS